MQLQVTHSSHFDYSAPVSLAHHLALLQPLQDAQQQLLDFNITVEPAADTHCDGRDLQGNACRWFSILKQHDELIVTSTSRVQLQPRAAELRSETSPPWDALAARLRYSAGAPFDAAVEFTMPSPFVPRLQVLHDYAASSMLPGRPVASVAIELMQRIHDDFKYESRSTQIETPLKQAFAQRRGVCQDFAHVMIGALRMHGVPARYVSGYLLTQPAVAGPHLVGADASHAWVQVYCPGTQGVGGDGWLDLDPTNEILPGAGHVRLAVGRDFGDVTPLRGVIRGGGHHSLSVAVTTLVLNNN